MVKSKRIVNLATEESVTAAAGMALDFIRNGICDCAVVGGVDSLSIIAAYGFNALKSLSGASGVVELISVILSMQYGKYIAEKCANADEFKAEVQKQYSDYSGGNYLDMTAGFFFAS